MANNTDLIHLPEEFAQLPWNDVFHGTRGITWDYFYAGGVYGCPAVATRDPGGPWHIWEVPRGLNKMLVHLEASAKRELQKALRNLLDVPEPE